MRAFILRFGQRGFIAVAWVAFAALPVAAQRELGEPESLRRDAQAYAADNGVSVDEAVRRLQFQREAGRLSARLQSEEQATFAGLLVEHRPEFRVVAKFTRDAAATVQRHTAGGPLAGLVRAEDARLSLARLEEVQRSALASVRARGIRAEAGIDVRNNRAEIYVLDRTPVESARARGELQLPEAARVVQVRILSTPEVDIFGGLAISTCTTGYSVQSSSGTRGVTTAGHCGNTQARSGVNLPFVREVEGGGYDVQWHTAPGFTVRPLMYDGTDFRYVYDALSRNAQALNSFVCKHGKTTGYTCGYLVDKNYTRTSISNSTATWMRVSRSGVNLSEGGDSGGPWFNGNTAYGTHAAGLGDDAIYMAADYVAASGLGISILVQAR